MADAEQRLPVSQLVEHWQAVSMLSPQGKAQAEQRKEDVAAGNEQEEQRVVHKYLISDPASIPPYHASNTCPHVSTWSTTYAVTAATPTSSICKFIIKLPLLLDYLIY